MLKQLSAITLEAENELQYNNIMKNDMIDKNDAFAALAILVACFTGICIFMTFFTFVMAAYKWIAEML